MKRLMPRVNDIAFYAFSQAADYLNQGAVLIRKQPFYVAITRYFADDVRSQVGNGEVEVAWDRYRGGLEIHDGARRQRRSAPRSGPACNLRIQHLIAMRMSVAIRLRHDQNKDPLDVHTLAMRLKGMGYGALAAGADEDPGLEGDPAFPARGRGAESRHGAAVCVGPFDASARTPEASMAEARARRLSRPGAQGACQGRPPLRQRARSRASIWR